MATPVFCCGFECGRTGGVGQHWSTAGTVSIGTSTVRSGDRSGRINPTANSPSFFILNHNVFGGNRHIGRFYIRFATLPSVNCHLANFGGLTSGPAVRFNQSDSKIYASVGTTLGASGISVTTGVWYRIDYDFNVNTSGADFCDVRVDGTACGQATATGTSSSSNVDTFGPNDPVTITCDIFYDDILLSGTSADYPLGPGFVNHFVPTADGAHNVAGANDFERGGTGTDIVNATTTAFQLIDDVPLDDTTPDTDDYINMIAPPNATDYVECIFGPAPGISTPTAGPRAVEVIAGIHQAGTGTGNMLISLNDNGTLGTVYSASTVAGTTTITYKRAHFADPPSAASVWHALNDGSNGDFRDLRMRFGSPAVLDVNPDQFLDCIMIEAEFSTGGLIEATAATTTVSAPTAVLTAVVTVVATACSVTVSAPDATIPQTITATAASVTVTANDATVTQQLVATATSVTVSAPDATLVAGTATITATAATVTITGNDATVVPGLATVIATAAVVNVSSVSMKFITQMMPSGLPGRRYGSFEKAAVAILEATAATVTVTANDAVVVAVVTIEATAATVTVTANDAQQVSRTVLADAATVTVTANDAVVVAGLATITATAATVTVTANDAIVVAGLATIVADAATVTVTANNAAIVAITTITADAATVTVTANNAVVVVVVTVEATAATVTVTANDVQQVSRTVLADAATVTVTANNAVLVAGLATITATAATVTVSANDAGIAAEGGPQTVIATAALVTVTANNAIIVAGLATITATAATVTVTANDAQQVSRTIPATAAETLVVANAAVLVAGLAAITANASTVTVSAPTAVLAASITVAGTPAIVLVSAEAVVLVTPVTVAAVASIVVVSPSGALVTTTVTISATPAIVVVSAGSTFIIIGEQPDVLYAVNARLRASGALNVTLKRSEGNVSLGSSQAANVRLRP